MLMKRLNSLKLSEESTSSVERSGKGGKQERSNHNTTINPQELQAPPYRTTSMSMDVGDSLTETASRPVPAPPTSTRLPIHKRTRVQYSSLVGPSFVAESCGDVVVTAGRTAKLVCAVRNLHSYTRRP